MKYLFLLQSKKKDINPFLFSIKRFGKLGLLPFFYFITFFSFSQEICDNGIDDDGDGLIDCYDSECSLNDDCNGFFFGNTVNCSDEIRVSTFALKEQWSSASETATSHALPIVGDLDGDGIPEVISINNLGTTNLSVLEGSSGTTLASKDLDFIPGNAPVIADVNSDGIADIFISENKGNQVNRLIYNSFRSEIVSSWKKAASLPQAIGLIGIADFDEDGDSEIYYRNEIMDAETGDVIVSGSGNWVQDYVHGPIAVDILGDDICPDCGGLELITGNEIWAINEENGTRTVIRNMNDVIHANIDPNLNYYPKYYSSWDGQWSSVSVADYNLDGNLDVLMSGALGSTTDTYNGTTTVFFWDVANSNIITYQDPGNNFERGTGRINIGDVDGDGNLNATFVMNQRLYSLDEEFNVHWIHPIMEGSSGFSGCSIFDFDGDGAYEIIYRSEESLVIIDGVGNGDNTTSIKSQITCVSNTQEEYPVIADVDGDGRSEICVSCFVNDALPNSPYNNTQFSQIRLYESNGEAWMPARHVWNQHGYFNVNINDNLTVPIEIQNHATIFSENICEYNDGTIIPYPSRPLNTFMNQGSLHNTDGCVKFISSDIEFIGIISASDASCPSAAITVTFQITNIGEINISGNLPISYYSGDPRSNNSILLDTETTFLRNFLIGQTLTISQDINGIGGNYNLYVVINDNGRTPPIPTPLPTGPVTECNTENNIQSIQIGYEPFSIIVEKVKDNQKCVTNVLDNGIARAYYAGSSMTQNYSHWLEDFENLSADATIDQGGTAWTYVAGFSGEVNQISSVRGSNQFIAKGTSIDNTDLVDAIWTSEDIDVSNLIDISISVDISETSNLESTGADADYIIASYTLRDVNGIITEAGVLNNGNLVGNFTFEQATINNLNQNRTASTLSIVILFHNQGEEIYAVDNISVEGTLLNVLTELTEQDGYIFNWYNPNDTLYINPVYTGSRYPQMTQGLYSVIGYYEMTECYSDTAQIEIDLSTTPAFNVHIFETSSLTNCTNPNGGLEAFAYTQIDINGIPIDTLRTVDGYTFTWVIQTEGVTPIGTGNSIQNLDAIGYTVEVLNTLSGCVISESKTVSSNVTLPVTFTVKTNHITSCGGMGLLSIEQLIGSANANDYIFKWYSGADVTPTPDTIGQSYSVSRIGLYTLVYELASSGCSSEPITVEIREEIENGLTPNVFAVLSNTSCVSSNGSAIAYGNNIVDVASYGYRWFVGTNVLNANLLPQAIPSSFLVNGNPNEIGGLPAGVYTVEINNPQNSCNTIRSIQIVDETMPRITLDLTGITVMNTLGNFCVGNQTGIISSGLSALSSNDGSPININRISLGNINGDFEVPDILTNTNEERRFQRRTIKWYNQAFIPGWNTTDTDGLIEIWHRSNRLSIPAFTGNQFAEINANQNATLYFDLATTPGLLLDWSFAHRARGGAGILYDSIAVNIGSPNTTIRQGVFAATNSGWVTNQGTYTIPNGQVTTRFAFQAVSTADNNNREGNFIDLVSFVLRPFRFELYTGNQASGTPIAVNTSGDFNDINIGNYTLALIDNITGCLQSTALINVPALEGIVTMESVLTQDDYCGTGGNGSITITALNSVGFTSSSYAYELYSGHTLDSASQIVNDSLDSSHPDFPLYTFSELNAGDYRVHIYPKANNTQACDFIMDFTINEEITLPVITNPVINSNTSCIDTTSNGFVSVEIENYQEENYFFTWYEGTNTTGAVISTSTLGGNTSRGNTITGLSSGNYTVVAKDSTTNCESLPFTLAISENPYNPNILITETSLHTNCSRGNGVLSASIQNSPDFATPTTTRNFSFQWQLNGVNLVDGDTASNGSIPVGAQNSSISGLISDEYTLVATHTISNCSSTENFILSNNRIIPSIELDGEITGNNFLSCLLGTGAAAVTVSPSGSYNYEWYDSDGTRITDDPMNPVGIKGSNTANISGLMHGTYKVVAVSTLECASDSLIIRVPDTRMALNFTIIPNSICDMDENDLAQPNANGSISIMLNTVGTTYNFTVLLGGREIAADGTTMGFENVRYNTTGLSTNITGLPTGLYQIQIFDNLSRCVFDNRSIFIQDIGQALTIDTANINANTVDNTACDSTFTGTATVSIEDITNDTTASSLADYRFSWTTAADLTTVIDNDSILDDDINGNSGVVDGDYVLTVTNLVTGCTSPNATISINSSQPTLVAGESNLMGNSVCDTLTNNPTNPDANGQITFTPTGGIGTFAFAFSLQTANGMDIAGDGSTTNFEDVNYDTTGVMATNVTGIPTGNYRMTIINEGTRCAIEHPFTIQDIGQALTIGTANINANTVDNTACDSTFTGTATVSIEDITNDTTASSLANYGFSWTTAADLTTVIDTDSILDDNINGNSGVVDGDYVLTVTNLVTGCTSPNATISINSSQPTLVAGESNLTGNSVCDTLTNNPTNPDANGQITFTPTGGIGTFAFSLQTANGMDIASDGSTTSFEDVNYDTTGVMTTNVTGIPTGNYRMTIINEGTRCAIEHPFTIQDIGQALTIDTANINANTVDNASCDSTAFTGTATVSLADITDDTTASSLADYRFSWTTAINPAKIIDDDEILDDDIDGNSGVVDGEYVLTVTNLITGCQSLSVNVTIGQNLPSITPTTQVLRDNFSCSAANPIGSATLTINEGPNTNYSFEWYVGSSVAGAPFDTDSLIEDRLHGNYTVLITDTATLCTEIARINIQEIMPTIITSTNSTDYSNCYPANGQASVMANATFSPNMPIGVDTNFVYQWFFGTSIDTANLLKEGVDPGNFSNPTDVTTSQVSGLVAGNYTVLVTNNLTRCFSEVEIVTVTDEVSPYRPTLKFTNVTFPSSCDSENGRITAEIIDVNPNGFGAGTNFTFEWYEGAQDFASLDSTGSEAALQTGDTLLRNPGGITVNVVNNGGTVGGTSTLTQIVSGLYTIVMIDQTTGCRYFETYELGFAGQQITTTLTIDNIVECGDNGVARVGLADNIILVVSPANILDTLTIGESFRTSPSGATGTIVLDNRNQLQVTLNTGSSTLNIGDTITGTSTGHTAVIDSIRGVGYATGPEHYDDISQYIIYLYSGSGVPSDRLNPYTFNDQRFPYSYNPVNGEVRDGDGDLLENGNTLSAGDSAIFNQLPAGDYIAIAQEIINPAFNPSATSQCWTAASKNDTILNLAYEPLIQNFSESSNSNCGITNENGQLSITVIENPSENLNPPALQQSNGYLFVWMKDADSSIVYRDSIFTERATSTTLADLEPGSYTVVIDRLGNQDSTSNMCKISRILTVGNNPEQHEVTSDSSTASTDCNPLSGAIIINDADITDSVANYTFTWYTTFIANDDSRNILLADSLVVGFNNRDIGANALSGLGSGTYFVQATHTNGCVTPAYSIQIDEQRLIPTFNLRELAPNTVCDSVLTPSGMASLTITNGVNPADYVINWFESDGTTPLDTTSATFNAARDTVSNLSDGIYFVQIEDTTNSIGCVSTLQSVTINQFTPTIFIRGTTPGTDFNITASNECSFNGSFQILNVSESRPGGSSVSIFNGDFALTNYSFNWFESDGTTFLNDTLVVGVNNGDASASQVAGLMPGVYFVQITNDSTGCEQPNADFIQFTILDSTIVPTFTFLTMDDLSCNDTNPTGQANIVITNGSANPTDYSINWFKSDTTALTSATFNAARDTVSNLSDGIYFVQIEDTTNSIGCVSTLQSVTINQFTPTIFIRGTTPGTDFNITASNDCSFNGSFEILNVSESRPGGSSVSIFNGDFALTNYSFEWFESDGTTLLHDTLVVGVNNGDASASQVAGLMPGVYFVQITNDSTGCEQPNADFIQFTILDSTIVPTFTFLTMDNLSCDLITTGQADIVITNGSANPTDYIINWVESDTVNALGTSTTTATFSNNNTTASNLPEGTYFVQIEDTTNSVGCRSALQSVTIDEFIPTIFIKDSTDFTNTASDDCSFNGSFQILNVSESRPGGSSVSIFNGDFALANYSFEWFESDGTTLLHDTLVVGVNNGDASASQVAGLMPGVYFVQITNDSTGCEQPSANFIPFTILDEAVNPVINLARPVSQNTYCDDRNNQGSGEISINIVDEGRETISNFSIVWYRGSISDANQIFPIDRGARGTATIDPLSTTISNLASGTYTVVVTKDRGDTLRVGNENCFASAVYNVTSRSDIPTLNQDDIQARTTNDTICGVRASGSLIIRDSDVSTGDLSDFEIRIYEDSVGGTELMGSPYDNITVTEISYDTLSANNYFITAQDTTTRCFVTTTIININDSIRNPQVTLTQLLASEACTSNDSSGSISVVVDNRFDHTNQMHLTFLWIDSVSGNGVMTDFGVTEDEAKITGVPSGVYTVTVTNTNTNCVTSRSYTVIDEIQSPSISDYSIVNNTVCNDNNDTTLIDDGIFDILEIIFNSNNFTKAQMGMDYQLNIVTLPDLNPVVDSNPLTPYTFEGLSSGEYRAFINRVTSGCLSNGLDFSISDEIERPLIDIVIQEADSTCSGGGTPNGTLYATISLGLITGIDHTDSDYTFSWYQGSGIGTPLGDTTSTISGLSAGIYTVRIERISTGCIVMKELELPNETVNFEIQTVATTGFTQCQPANGVINITGINRGNLNNYRFEFYNQDPTNGTSTPIFTVPTDGPIFNTAMVGIHYIIGTDTLSNCLSAIFTAEVDDNSSYPIIRLDDFSFQENCSGNNPNGKLSVLANGQPENGFYDFEWFYGTDNSNPLTADDLNVGVNLFGASTNTVVGLEAGFYTVEVISNATGCSVLNTYEMSDNISNPIKITTSVSFNTNCVTPNGQIAVSILNRGNPPRPLSDWDYYWFNGNIATVGLNPNLANAIYKGTLIDSLIGGYYVVLVIDRDDNTCRSIVQEIIVEDVSIQPITYDLTVSHATICSENKNGFASVITENLSSVHINWYDFARNNIGNTFFIDSLVAGIYSFELTQVNTGCILSEVFEIQNRATTPSNPTIFINKGRDNCLNPNGNAVANSGGLSRNFLFEWFDPRDMSTPYTTGSEVFNLDTITYLVRATNIATDCESAFTSVEIGNEFLDPEYKISISKSLCSRTEDGSANLYSGNAVIDFGEFNRATDYRWILDRTGEIVGEHSQLIDATPGDYTVFFTAQNGCEYSDSFTIGSAITIYNGLSANFDGKNDFLLIDCIDNFPNNNVKIFNRSGQIVFDLDHYNNMSLRFDGQSNVGSSQLRLPAGTYFYVIDLGNNEDNMQGYIELLR